MPLIGVGGSTFSGGTITNPLVINTPAQIGLAIKGTGGYDDVEINADGGGFLLDPSGNYGLIWDADGRLQVLIRGGTGKAFRVYFVDPTSGSTTLRFSVSEDGVIALGGTTLGFFGGAPVAQRTIHSATATPESLALALEAATLMTGD